MQYGSYDVALMALWTF